MLEKSPKSPWTARRSNQSVLREINPEYSLEGLMLKLKLQYFGCLMWTDNSLESLWCWERLRIEGKEGVRGWDGWTASLMQWIWIWANFGRWWGTGRLNLLQSVGSERVGYNCVTEQQQRFWYYKEIGTWSRPNCNLTVNRKAMEFF